jgi:hypothetical protein
MNIKKHILLLIPALAALGNFSCERDADLDLPDGQGQFLIVEGNIDDVNSRQMIRLHRSGSYNDTQRDQPVSGATVSVSDGTTEYFFTESSPNGNYINHEIGGNLKSDNYYLTIKDNNRTYTARSELLPVPQIDSVTARVNSLSGLGIIDKAYYDVYIHFRNLPVSGNYYLVNLYVNNKIKTYTPPQKAVLSDLDQKNYVSLYTRTIRGEDVRKGDTLTLEMRSISRMQYDFYSNFIFQTGLSGNPFASAPPANLPTNMSKGALGFFQVSRVSAAQMIF